MKSIAVILAGGRGERLRPLTNDRPKPMVEIKGVPILGFQFEWLRQHGVNTAIIACGYLWEVIREYFGDGKRWLHLNRVMNRHAPPGRGGALRKAMSDYLVHDYADLFIGLNGDNLSQVPLTSVVQQHKTSGLPATIVVTPLVSPFGIVEIDGACVKGFREKPELDHWINAGIYVLDPEMRDLFPEHGDHEDSTFPNLAAQRRLGVYCSRDWLQTIDTLKDLLEAEKALGEHA